MVELEMRYMSLPVRGAWIEMYSMPLFFAALKRRSPCGERGLKCAKYGA